MEDRREQVADAAGLGPVHGGTTKQGRTALSWQGACDQESGTRITVSRIWDNSKGEPPTHIPLECPVCQEEHLLPRS